MRRGYTVIELLITMALVLLLFGLAFNIIVPSLRLWVGNQAQATIEETGLVLESRIQREMERSTWASVTPGNGAFSFATFGHEDDPDAYDPQTGQVQWQGFTIYFLRGGGHTVYRKEWPVPTAAVQIPPLGYVFPTGTPTPLSVADLTAICDTTNGTERGVGNSVSQLQLAVIPASKAGSGSSAVEISRASNVLLTIELDMPAPNGFISLQGPGAPANSVMTQRTQQFQLRM